MNNSDDLDPRLQHLYRQLAKEQPSPELDANILAAAQHAIKKPSRWLMPFSIAASVVMVSSLVLYLAKQPQQLEQALAVNSAKSVVEPEIAISQEDDKLVAPAFDEASPPAPAKANKDISAEKKSVVTQANERRIATDMTSAPSPVIASQEANTVERDALNDKPDQFDAPIIAESQLAAQQPLLAAAPMASAGAMMSSAKQETVQKSSKLRVDAKEKAINVMPSRESLSIEHVSLGMTRTQVMAQGLRCEGDICHTEIKQPQQAAYWGIATLNASLTAILSGDSVTKLVLTQKIAAIEQVKSSLLMIGSESDQLCSDEMGILVLSRQSTSYLLNLRSMEAGVSLTICSY